MIPCLLFYVDHMQCALPLPAVRIVLQMVQTGPVTETRPGLYGTVNFHGQIIPVFSVRSFFGIPDRAPQLTDKLIVTEGGADSVALWADETHVRQQSSVPPAVDENAGMQQSLAPGVTLTGEGIIFFSDLSRFLEPGNFTLIKIPPDAGGKK